MNVIKKVVARVFFPRKFKFINNLGDAFLQAVRETLKFEAPIRNLCQTWLAVCPHTYFSELFLESESWNAPFVRAFDRSNMVDAQACFQLTQAYYLRHLLRIIIQDEKYKKYSKDIITHNILSHMAFGSKIIALATDFEKEIKDASSVEDISMCYVEKILQIQYPNQNILGSILSSIWVDNTSMFGLTLFMTASLKQAKYVDSQNSLVS